MHSLEEIRQAAKEGVDAALGEFRIEREQHYEDHQFVKGVREGITTARKGSLTALGITFVGFMVWAVKDWLIKLVH